MTEKAEKTTMSFSDEVTSRHGGETLTACYQCGTCASSCPVARLDSSFKLRNIALEAGHSPNIYSDFASALIAEGRIVQISKFVEKKREEYGLPPLKPVGVDALNKILSATGFSKPEKTESSQ